MKTLKVLVVDDVPSMRKFAKFGLEKGFPHVSIDEAASGKEAQSKIEATEYDLVLCDWEMPDIKGYEVLQWLRQHPVAKSMPFIMVTSRNDKESVVKAIEAGANSYVVKPYTAEMLAQKITAVIERFDRRRHERFNATGTAIIHFRDLVARGALIDLSLGGLFCTVNRKEPIPAIFEKVLLDIKLEGNVKSNGLEGFVIRIQAAEAFIDAEEIKLAFKFMDELPAEKKEELLTLLDAVKETNG